MAWLPQFAGDIASDLSISELSQQLSNVGLRSEMRFSSHYTDGIYLRLYIGADVILEREAPSNYVVRGEATTAEQIRAALVQLSSCLTLLDIRHAIEAYDESTAIIDCLHYNWPCSDEQP